MIHEKSCGAVIYTEVAGERRYLVEEMKKGHFAMCKGHVEGQETELETADREIREETALEVTFCSGFRRATAYSPYPGCEKEVVYYLALARGTETFPQEAEVRAIRWEPYEAARAHLTYENDRVILEAAEAFLNR